ncbi:hypothetical protein FPZ12_035055 [Amycolatopsis acidicola]|uniref:Hemophore-related protein n=1 Tax=Amycolatopsis acidicola TaxID=2596893 RepID=A0A5N0URA7_9PSEU|nr:hypothetical protein [Amycolatopsis acidicola]KAA9153265.1 hypothetical protein FPZ12_035055 [Amycolatopsis acidicola]
MRIPARAALAACGAAALLAAGAPVASADTTTYAPITLSPEESQHLCADVLPRLIDRKTKLADKINGGADVQGSVAWLRAKAQDQRGKGHAKIADRLGARADRRAGRVDDLKSVDQRLTDFKNAHCVAK